MPLAPVTEPHTIALLEAILAELRGIRAAVERGRAPRDEADAAVLLAIREAIADRPFTAGELIRHAAINLELHAALTSADITGAVDAGTLFRRLQGVDVRGLRIEHLGKSRDGVTWRVRL